MSTTSIVLIVVAVAVMFLMHRVGHGAHAQAHGGSSSGGHVHGAQQISAAQVTSSGEELEHGQHEGQTDEGQTTSDQHDQHRRHGCC